MKENVMGPDAHQRLMFTEHGRLSLKNRLRSMVDIFNNNEFPFKASFLGFGVCKFKDGDEVLLRIDELSQLLRIDLFLDTKEEKQKSGKVVKTRVLRWEK